MARTHWVIYSATLARLYIEIGEVTCTKKRRAVCFDTKAARQTGAQVHAELRLLTMAPGGGRHRGETWNR